MTTVRFCPIITFSASRTINIHFIHLIPTDNPLPLAPINPKILFLEAIPIEIINKCNNSILEIILMS